MLTVPAVKIQQFRQEFYLLNLSATDVQRLVRSNIDVLICRSGDRDRRQLRISARPGWYRREGG